MDGVLELSSDRRRKSGRCARANACQPKYWLNGDNERGGNAVRSEDHNGSGASMVYGRVLFLFHYRQSVGSENVSRHCSASSNAVVASTETASAVIPARMIQTLRKRSLRTVRIIGWKATVTSLFRVFLFVFLSAPLHRHQRQRQGA